MSTYDSDPEALTWARGRVEFYINRLNGWADGGSKHADEMRRTANMLHRWFIGGEGCVIAAFDHRRPEITTYRTELAAARDHANQPETEENEK